MKTIRWGCTGLLAALAILAAPGRAGAAAGLTFAAPSACPSEEQFVAAVAARGGDLERLRSGGADRSVDISIAKSGAGFSGSLQVHAGAGASDPREVHAETCGAVVDGLAVVTAVALGGPGELAAGAAPAAPSGATTAPALAAPAPPPEDTTLHGLHGPQTHTIRVEAGDLDVGRSFSASLDGGLVVGLVPGLVLPRYDLTLSTANFITPPGGLHYLVGAVVAVHVSYLGQATYKTSNSSTDVNGASWGIGICRSLHYDTRGFAALLCVEYIGGQLNLETHDLVAGKTISKSTGFGQGGLYTQLQYNLAGHFHVHLKVGGDLILGSTMSAERADGSAIFTTAKTALSGYAVAGIGFHF
jgi:hypothetical protein